MQDYSALCVAVMVILRNGQFSTELKISEVLISFSDFLSWTVFLIAISVLFHLWYILNFFDILNLKYLHLQKKWKRYFDLAVCMFRILYSYCCALCYDLTTYCAKSTVLFSSETVSSLLDHMLNGERIESVVVNGVSILQTLLECRKVR